MAEEYRVQLDVFSGPLDLLLFLIRRDEVDILDIPVARITEQYIDYVGVLEQLDPNAAGDFLVMASTLVELKSRSLLPSPPIEDLDDSDDPRAPLVRQLLEYKRFKDVAQQLGRAADDRGRRYVRRPADLPKELEGLELEEVQVWDLLAAFGRVMSAIGHGPYRHHIEYDDTPIELFAAEVLAILEREGPTTFQALFDGEWERMHLVGRFLALLELVRARRVRAEQETTFGTIYLFLLEELEEPEPAAEQEPQENAAGKPVPLTDPQADDPRTEAPPQSSEPADISSLAPTDSRPETETRHEQAE